MILVRVIASIVLGMGFCAAASAQQTKAQMNAYNNAVIVTNGVGAITAANLHPLLQNMINASCTIADPINCPISALSGATTPSAPLIGASSGGGVVQGARSGNTVTFPTVDTSPVTGDCAIFDSSGGLGPLACATLPLNITTTGQFFQNLGAAIQRMNDRAFVGGATISDGSFPSSSLDWLATFQTSYGAPTYDEVSMMNVLTSPTNTSAQTAFLAADQSLGKTLSNNSIGGTFFGINNNVSTANIAWGIYTEADRVNNTAGQTNGIESEVTNKGADVPVNPFSSTAFATTAQEVGCGGGISAVGQFNCSAGFMVFANPMPFDAGLLFLNGSISTSFGGQKNAIVMPSPYTISWINSSSAILALITADTSGDLVLAPTAAISIGGHLSVSCSAGTVVLSTLVVTNGIVTTC